MSVKNFLILFILFGRGSVYFCIQSNNSLVIKIKLKKKEEKKKGEIPNVINYMTFPYVTILIVLSLT